jgi:hypothetical protein
VYPTFTERKSIGIHSHYSKLEADNIEKHGIETYVADTNCNPTANIKNKQTNRFTLNTNFRTESSWRRE